MSNTKFTPGVASELLEALQNLLKETKRITDAFDDKHLEAAEQYAKQVIAKATNQDHTTPNTSKSAL